MNDDYKGLFFGHHVYDTPYSATGFSSTIIAARVSYVYNLQGPCLALDTACSSGMVAVHLGSQALLAGKLTNKPVIDDIVFIILFSSVMSDHVNDIDIIISLRT